MMNVPAFRDTRIDGFLLEEMAPAGQEVVVGAVRDPQFGPLVMVGLGGIFVEVLADVAFRICPVNRLDAHEMLAELKGAAVLKGARGLTLSEMGWVFSAGALGNSLLAIFFSRFNPRRGFLFSQMLVALFALLIWQGTGLPIFMLGYFLLGGFRAARPMAMAQARDLVHDSQMGLSYGTMETVSAIIFIIAPPIAGFIFERDPFFVYPLAVGLIVISILVSYFFSPRKSENVIRNS
jgi:MFS family permease